MGDSCKLMIILEKAGLLLTTKSYDADQQQNHAAEAGDMPSNSKTMVA